MVTEAKKKQKEKIKKQSFFGKIFGRKPKLDLPNEIIINPHEEEKKPVYGPY